MPRARRDGRRVRDGARVRRSASALRAGPGSRGRAARTAARRSAHRLPPQCRATSGPVQGRSGGPQPACGPGRGAALGMPHRRCAVARSDLGPDARLRRATPSRRSRSRSVFAIREPSDGDDLAGLEDLWVRGLSDGDARALLASQVTGPVDERVRDRIVAETRGNPLALLELPGVMTQAELAGAFGLPDTMPMAGRIELGFARRLETLSGRDPTAPARRRRRPGGRSSTLLWRAARATRHPGRGGRRSRSRRGPRRDRRACPVPPSGRAIGGLQDGVGRTICRTSIARSQR